MFKWIFRKRKTKIFDVFDFSMSIKNRETRDLFFYIVIDINENKCNEYNKYDYSEGEVWYEDESGVKWQSKSYYRDYKINQILK